MSTEATRISEATNAADFTTVRELFEEYAVALGVDLSFQNFADELGRMREMYGPPRGCLLVARCGQSAVGCVAFRSFGADVCEMKRLYVRPAARGRNVGRELTIAIIDKAHAAGY